MTPNVALSDFTSVELTNLGSFFGIESGDIWQKLLGSEIVWKRVSVQFQSNFCYEFDKDIKMRPVLEHIANFDPTTLQTVSKVVTSLVFYPQLISSADGYRLKLICDFSDIPNLFQIIVAKRLPKFSLLPTDVVIEESTLSDYSDHISRYILGLLPGVAQKRVKLRFDPGTFPEPLRISTEDNNKGILIFLVGYALMISSRESIAADAKT